MNKEIPQTSAKLMTELGYDFDNWFSKKENPLINDNIAKIHTRLMSIVQKQEIAQDIDINIQKLDYQPNVNINDTHLYQRIGIQGLHIASIKYITANIESENTTQKDQPLILLLPFGGFQKNWGYVMTELAWIPMWAKNRKEFLYDMLSSQAEIFIKHRVLNKEDTFMPQEIADNSDISYKYSHLVESSNGRGMFVHSDIIADKTQPVWQMNEEKLQLFEESLTSIFAVCKKHEDLLKTNQSITKRVFA